MDDFSSNVDLPSTQETVETIDANHTQMTKYNSKDDSGYRAVLGVLKAFIGRLSRAPEGVPAEVPVLSCMPIVVPQARFQGLTNVSISVNTVQSDNATTSTSKVHFMVPFQRNGDLIGREKYIQSLEAKLCVPNKYCRVALVGLGGIGYASTQFFSSQRFANTNVTQ